MVKNEDPFNQLPWYEAAKASIPATACYLLFAWAVLAALPERAWDIKNGIIISFSLFGIWRYSWQMWHIVRHYRYSLSYFPRLRAEAMSLKDKYPKRLYIMVPSFKEDKSVSQLVFSALIRESLTIPSEIFIYASVGSDEEIHFISKVISSTPGGSSLNIVFMHQNQGKRIAMGHALRAIARHYNDPYSWHPDAANDIVIFMDGDSLVEPGMFKKTLPYFRSNKSLGALTTNSVGVSPNYASIFQDWYTVKFAQRHHIFQSHSLSRRVLTMTGRFSMYRSSVVVKEEFIRFLEADHLDHWLFGRFRFLMGDDKSTWFYLLKERMDMLYIPDAKVLALETRESSFFKTSMSLMKRWYGNMLRNNWRAIKLGPRNMGGFIWWCIVDQRLSAFTPLVGPCAVLLLGIFQSWYFVAFYLAWVVIARLAMMWVYVLQGMKLTILHVPLTIYNQWIGSLLKIQNMHNLAKQSWNKTSKKDKKKKTQLVGTMDVGNRLARKIVRFSMLTFTKVALIAICALLTGVVTLPRMYELVHYSRVITNVPQAIAEDTHDPSMAVRTITASSSKEINAAIESCPASELLEINIPAGTFILNEPIRVNRSSVKINGAGRDKTKLISKLKVEQGKAIFDIGGQKGSLVGQTKIAARKGDRTIAIDGFPEKAPYIWIRIANSPEFFDSIGDTNWRKSKPWIRFFIAEVAWTTKGFVGLKQPLPITFPKGTMVRSASPVSNVTLSGFTLEQQAPEAKSKKIKETYENIAPAYAIDGIRLDWAVKSKIKDINIINAGRHPLVFENSRDNIADNIHIDGAWNKGKQGNGYIRFARSYNNVLSNSTARNIRHLAFQWGAANNRVKNCELFTDINFHGGYSQNNVVTDSAVTPPATHPWKAVTRMPKGGAAWAPPDGPGNDVIFRKNQKN
ncbi:glycosyltransferase [Marinifilum sp. JC120]|nr:glycosyltransferase [Marinifilum sp. JC120]